MKFIIEIVLKVFSLLIAGMVLFYAIYYFPQWSNVGLIGYPGSGPVTSILMLIGWLVISMGCIWFAVYVSEWLEELGKGGWNPTWLVKFTGWVFLLIPVIILILLHYKVLQ